MIQSRLHRPGGVYPTTSSPRIFAGGLVAVRVRNLPRSVPYRQTLFRSQDHPASYRTLTPLPPKRVAYPCRTTFRRNLQGFGIWAERLDSASNLGPNSYPCVASELGGTLH